MDPFIPPQYNLVFQIVIFLTLSASVGAKRRRKYFLHGAMMLVAVLLNLTSFALVMLPSWTSLEIIRTQPLHYFSLAALGHAVLGALGIILGLWIVLSWHMQSSTQGCIRKRKIMRLTIVLWILTLIIGIVLYKYLYVG